MLRTPHPDRSAQLYKQYVTRSMFKTYALWKTLHYLKTQSDYSWEMITKIRGWTMGEVHMLVFSLAKMIPSN